METVSEKWQMIQFARKHGAKVKNEKGEVVWESTEYPDAVKCFVSFTYYYFSSAEKYEYTFDGKTYDEWHNEKVFDVI